MRSQRKFVFAIFRSDSDHNLHTRLFTISRMLRLLKNDVHLGQIAVCGCLLTFKLILDAA